LQPKRKQKLQSTSPVEAPDSVTVGDDATLTVTVENTGDAAGNTTVTATIGGEEVSEDVNLDSGASETVNFEFDTSSAGDIDWVRRR